MGFDATHMDNSKITETAPLPTIHNITTNELNEKQWINCGKKSPQK